MAAGDLRPYDSDQITAVLSGISLLEGLADGEFLRWERETDDFDDIAGTDGEVSRSKTNDGRVTITLLLMSTSPTNDKLSVLINSDLAAPGGVGIGALLIKDAQGTDLLAVPKAWIKRRPDRTWDRTATTVEWVIRGAASAEFHGGNVIAA